MGESRGKYQGKAKGFTGVAPEPMSQVDTPAPAGEAPTLAGEIGGKQLYELLKVIGKRKTIYHWNIEGIQIYESIYSIVYDALLYNKPIVEFTVRQPPTGKWIYSIYCFNNVFIIKKTWIPQPPYSWEEEVVELITVEPGEDP